MLIIDAPEIEQLLSMAAAIACLKSAYQQDIFQTAVIPARTIVELPNQQAELLFMPGYVPQLNIAGFKAASLFPHNKKNHLPTIQAKVLLVDTNTGQWQAILDGDAITALRTGAMTGMAADLTLPSTVKSLAIIGAGVQARAQLAAICAVRNFNEVRIFSRSADSLKAFIREIKHHESYKNITIIQCDNIIEAIENVDVVCFTTSHTEAQPLISADKFAAHTNIYAVGGANSTACEFPPELLPEALVITDSLATCATESGEIAAALAAKKLHLDNIIDLFVLVKRKESANSKQRVIFRSVGFSFPDIIIAKKVYDQKIEQRLH